MRSLVRQPPAPTTKPGAGFFASLDREWGYLARSPAARAGAWTTGASETGASEPALLGLSAGQAVSRVTWDGYRPTAEGAHVLSALLLVADAPLAARSLLQALLPRIRAERVQTAMYGHGVGERWPRPADTVADLVAECFAAIKRHAGEDRADVDRLIVGEAARRLRTARQAQRRYQSRTAAPALGERGQSTGDFSSARSGAEWLAGAVVDAVGRGQLSVAQARLLYAVRVKGLPASEVGRAQGLAPKAVYYALDRAEAALVASLSGPPRARWAGAAGPAPSSPPRAA